MERACVSPLGVGEHGVHAGRGPGVRVLYRAHVSGLKAKSCPLTSFSQRLREARDSLQI